MIGRMTDSREEFATVLWILPSRMQAFRFCMFQRVKLTRLHRFVSNWRTYSVHVPAQHRPDHGGRRDSDAEPRPPNTRRDATASDRGPKHSRGRVFPNGRPPKWRPGVAELSIGHRSIPSRRSSPNSPAPKHKPAPERPERPPLEARVALREPRRLPALAHPEPAGVAANPPLAPPEERRSCCWGEAGPAAD